MHAESVRGDAALRIEIALERPSGGHVIEKFDGTDFHHPMPVGWIQPRRFCVENYLSHALFYILHLLASRERKL
jgi:hypothetical protein